MAVGRAPPAPAGGPPGRPSRFDGPGHRPGATEADGRRDRPLGDDCHPCVADPRQHGPTVVRPRRAGSAPPWLRLGLLRWCVAIHADPQGRCRPGSPSAPGLCRDPHRLHRPGATHVVDRRAAGTGRGDPRRPRGLGANPPTRRACLRCDVATSSTRGPPVPPRRPARPPAGRHVAILIGPAGSAPSCSAGPSTDRASTVTGPRSTRPRLTSGRPVRHSTSVLPRAPTVAGTVSPVYDPAHYADTAPGVPGAVAVSRRSARTAPIHRGAHSRSGRRCSSRPPPRSTSTPRPREFLRRAGLPVVEPDDRISTPSQERRASARGSSHVGTGRLDPATRRDSAPGIAWKAFSSRLR
ncbi:hypothetical protein FHR81_000163 [Actinoalloteichus hoggarensis]|uniref:Uncharacterized protein n=1 Tax=Actinoalloteichus hoggarensis TaxID=1470176 RepID=A0A221W362_9PSEU|nr:hypothetical protein AHOG_12550 [Actinoalloteichus hoggarensis]MBB5919134.1 hypothetical protein [Actinoalloteichus hoggarensis]